MKLHLVDSDLEVAEALKAAFKDFAQVEVRQGDLLSLAEDCVVSPANGYGFMDGGFDKDLVSFFGPEIQSRVLAAINERTGGVLPLGASILVKTGHCRIRYLIVAPTMVLPEFVEPINAYRAMRAIMRISKSIDSVCPQIFCPGLATGVGGVSPGEAAREMARAYGHHQ